MHAEIKIKIALTRTGIYWLLCLKFKMQRRRTTDMTLENLEEREETDGCLMGDL